jgi:hypothetical protein
MSDEQDVKEPEIRPIKNVDALLIASQNSDVPRESSPVEKPVETVQEVSVTPEQETDEAVEQPADAHQQEDKVDNKSDKVDKESPKTDTDEYGTPVTGKKKLYTEEEVNLKIRERLKRGQYAEQQQQPQVLQHQTPPNTPESGEDESWEVTLDKYVDKRIDRRQQEAQELQWQQKQRQEQSEFEEKFSSGMSKYEDFKEVVAGQPLTDTMMLATKSMNNPAAFIYAAAKTQPAELERISKIPDALIQAAEIGRLEEKMKKVRNAASHAKPIKTAKSDMVEGKEVKKQSIDSLIHAHAKTKFRR